MVRTTYSYDVVSVSIMKAIHKYSIPGSLKSLQIFNGITHSILLRTEDLWLKLSRDFKYYFGFVVE